MTIKKGLKTIASSVPTTEWGSIEGTLTDQVDLRNALNTKAPTNSPSFTGIPTAPTASLNTSNNQLATTKYVADAIIAAGSDLPPMEGHNGEYLKTDGTTTSWSKVDALPSQSGQNGKFLTTNGTTASWADVDVSGYAKLNEENSFTKGQTITRSTEGAILKLIGTTSNTNFLLERSGGSTCVLESGASVGLFGTVSNHPLQLRTNYTNRMTIGTDGSVKLEQDVANTSNDNQVATTKWTHSYVQSRGENLITNGLGTLGDNYNFTSFTFDNGAFKTTEVNAEVKIDEYIPFNPYPHNLSYVLYTDNASARYQAFVEFYDSSKTLIPVSGQNHLLIGSETSIPANTWTDFRTNFNYSGVENATYIKIGWIVGKNVSTCTTKIRYITLTTYASLYSPNLLGTPTAPTATKGTNTTQIATTAFVKTAVDDVTLTSGNSISINNKAINYTGTKFVRLATRSWTKAQWEQYCSRGVTTSISPSYSVDGIKVGDLVSVEGIVTDKGNTNVLAWGIAQSVGSNISVLFMGLSYGTLGGELPEQTGQSGKFLTTNGSEASWGTINVPNIQVVNERPTTPVEGVIYIVTG